MIGLSEYVTGFWARRCEDKSAGVGMGNSWERFSFWLKSNQNKQTNEKQARDREDDVSFDTAHVCSPPSWMWTQLGEEGMRRPRTILLQQGTCWRWEPVCSGWQPKRWSHEPLECLLSEVLDSSCWTVSELKAQSNFELTWVWCGEETATWGTSWAQGGENGGRRESTVRAWPPVWGGRRKTGEWRRDMEHLVLSAGFWWRHRLEHLATEPEPPVDGCGGAHGPL